LYYLICNEKDSFISKGKGGAQPNISQAIIKEHEINLPPLAEQYQIAEKIDGLLAQVDRLKARLDAIPSILKRFRQSVLAAAVSGKLTEDWREERGMLFESWKFDAAKNLCEKVQSGSTPRDNPFDQDGTIPFLKVYNIVNQRINFDYKPQFVTEAVHKKTLARSVALPNDILMNIVGPPLGKIAILTNQYPEWNLNQAITLFRVNSDLLLNKFMYYVLCEGALVRDVMPDTKGSVGQINISLSQCRDAVIPAPTILEQAEIVRRVEQLFAYADQIEQRVKDAQTRVNNLTQSILAKAFRGELTAEWREQNPNFISGENSAAALLDRIKSERAAQAAIKKPRGKAGVKY
jgi:type I restriction enzyme S subunit